MLTLSSTISELATELNVTLNEIKRGSKDWSSDKLSGKLFSNTKFYFKSSCNGCGKDFLFSTKCGKKEEELCLFVDQGCDCVPTKKAKQTVSQIISLKEKPLPPAVQEEPAQEESVQEEPEAKEEEPEIQEELTCISCKTTIIKVKNNNEKKNQQVYNELVEYCCNALVDLAVENETIDEFYEEVLGLDDTIEKDLFFSDYDSEINYEKTVDILDKKKIPKEVFSILVNDNNFSKTIQEIREEQGEDQDLITSPFLNYQKEKDIYCSNCVQEEDEEKITRSFKPKCCNENRKMNLLQATLSDLYETCWFCTFEKFKNKPSLMVRKRKNFSIKDFTTKDFMKLHIRNDNIDEESEDEEIKDDKPKRTNVKKLTKKEREEIIENVPIFIKE